MNLNAYIFVKSCPKHGCSIFTLGIFDAEAFRPSNEYSMVNSLLPRRGQQDLSDDGQASYKQG